MADVKKLILFILLTIASNLFAQAQPIKSLSLGNKWFYRQSGGGHPIDTYVYTYKLETIADTTVDHYLFTKIEHSNINFFNFYLSFPYNQQKSSYFERSDTALVESIFSAGMHRETVYDFSMGIGDTLFNPARPPYYYPYFTILAKGDTILFGETLPFIKIKAISYYWGSLGGGEVIITEKFGVIWVHFTGIDHWYEKELQGAVIDGKVFGDTTSPLSWVQNVQIKYDEIGQPLQPELLINFSKSIDMNTFNNTSFFMNSSLSGRHDNLRLNYQPDQHSLSIISNRGLFAGETITLTFTNSIQTTDLWHVNAPENQNIIINVTQGSGEFTPEISLKLPEIPSDICCGDFDLDEDVDFIAVTDKAMFFLDCEQTTKSYLITKMNDQHSRIFSVDIDQDGDLDLIASSYSTYIYLNYNRASSYEISKVISYLDIWSQIACDLNSDGYPDLINGYKGGKVVIFYGPDYPVSLSSRGNYKILDISTLNPHSILCGDWNNDGFFDLAINDIDSSNLLIMVNDSKGSFNPQEYLTIADTHYPRNVVAVDIDHDNDLDLVLSSGIVIKNNGRGRFDERNEFQFSGNNLVAGDIDGDEDIDIVGTEDDKLISFLNDGIGNFSRQSEVLLPDRVFKLILVDHDFDGDLDVVAIFYNKKLVQILNNGSKTLAEKKSSNLIYGFELKNCYPNPFNSSTEIRYSLPNGKARYLVQLKIYDVLGRLVKTLVDQEQSAGSYAIIWDGTVLSGNRAASGVYFYSLDSGEFKLIRKMLVLQ
jgi:hypothetical protein